MTLKSSPLVRMPVFSKLALLMFVALAAQAASAANIVNWGGTDYVTANQLYAGTQTTANGNFNADAFAGDQQRSIAYSNSSTRNPTSGYDTTRTSAVFYGGFVGERYSTTGAQVTVDPMINTSAGVLQNAAGDRLHLQARDGSERYFGVWQWNKADFIGSPVDAISFDGSSSLTASITAISNSNLRFFVVEGANTFVSQSFTTSQVGVNPASLSWFSYSGFNNADPSSMKLTGLVAATPTFANITAVGLVGQATNSNNLMTISSFSVDAAVVSVPEPSTALLGILGIACVAALRRRVAHRRP